MYVTPNTANTSLGVLLRWKRREDRPGDSEGVREPRRDGPDDLIGAGAVVIEVEAGLPEAKEAAPSVPGTTSRPFR